MSDYNDIRKLKLNDLQPSQLYISEKKLKAIREWFNPEDLSVFVDLKSVAFGSFSGADPVFDLTVNAEGDHLLILFLVHGRISVSGSPHPAGPSNAVKRSGRKFHCL